jgi:hypothetical protein
MRSMILAIVLAALSSAVFARVGFHIGAASNLDACPQTFRALELCEAVSRIPTSCAEQTMKSWEEATEAKTELKRFRTLCGAPCAVAQ